jgi:hypothetical protein
MKRALIALAVLLFALLGAYGLWARGVEQREEAAAVPLFVPVVVTPSLQLVSGQVLLYKATNLLEDRATRVRLLLFHDDDGEPFLTKDLTVLPARTVSYVYEPPASQLTLGSVTGTAPAAVRAIFSPIPADNPSVMRRIVPNVQIMRVQAGSNPPTFDSPVVVPLEHCRWEPRGFVPYTGGRWYWNCAPEMSPLAERWRRAGQR